MNGYEERQAWCNLQVKQCDRNPRNEEIASLLCTCVLSQGNAFKRGLRPKDMRDRQRLQDQIDAQADEIQLLKEMIEKLSAAPYDPSVPSGSGNPPCGY